MTDHAPTESVCHHVVEQKVREEMIDSEPLMTVMSEAEQKDAAQLKIEFCGTHKFDNFWKTVVKGTALFVRMVKSGKYQRSVQEEVEESEHVQAQVDSDLAAEEHEVDDSVDAHEPRAKRRNRGRAVPRVRQTNFLWR